MKACLISLTASSSNGRVVNEDLDGVGAPIDDALHGNVRQQIGQAAGLGVVVAGFFIGQQQAGVRRARLRGFQAKLGIEQNGAEHAASGCG